MNRDDAPVIPDPDPPTQDPGAPVTEPEPVEPIKFDTEYEGYDEALAETFPASDPPAAAQPGLR